MICEMNDATVNGNCPPNKFKLWFKPRIGAFDSAAHVTANRGDSLVDELLAGSVNSPPCEHVEADSDIRIVSCSLNYTDFDFEHWADAQPVRADDACGQALSKQIVLLIISHKRDWLKVEDTSRKCGKEANERLSDERRSMAEVLVQVQFSERLTNLGSVLDKRNCNNLAFRFASLCILKPMTPHDVR
jgi:hypothetical protein